CLPHLLKIIKTNFCCVLVYKKTRIHYFLQIALLVFQSAQLFGFWFSISLPDSNFSFLYKVSLNKNTSVSS
ncbi:MAG: hypothetical protein Q7J85_01430, partial [Bacillota bacterium]|nr:hypothetical protein [Bacillota bacterium]